MREKKNITQLALVAERLEWLLILYLQAVELIDKRHAPSHGSQSPGLAIVSRSNEVDGTRRG